MYRESFARWVSIVGHPFVLLLLYVVAAVSAYLPLKEALVATAIVFFLAILPMTLFLQRQVTAGRTNFDVSAQELRGPVYALGLVLGLVLLALFFWLEAPRNLLFALADGIVLVVAASLINLWLKVSLHTAFAVWVAFGTWTLHPRLGFALGLFALLVIWSRLELCRHTRSEVVAGLLLGLLMALPLFWVSSPSV